MQIKLLTARLIDGVHRAEKAVVDVEDSLARYLVGNKLAEKTASMPEAPEADAKPKRGAK